MELMILDTSYSAVHLVDKYESLIWTDRFTECGDFEIYTPATVEEMSKYRVGYYLINRDSDRTMIIEGIELESDSEDGDKLKITGRSLESILDRRIIWSDSKADNLSFQDGIKKLITENIMEPTVATRKISNFIFKESTDKRILDQKISYEYYGDNLYEVIQKACAEKHIGFKVILTEDNKFEFSLYLGTDRSYSQFDNPYVIFSPKFDNIISSNYMNSIVKFKNTVVVSKDQDKKHHTVVVHKDNKEASDLDRREILVTESKDKSTDDTMKQTGLEELNKNDIEELFEGEVDTSNMYRYARDFSIGDIVQIKNDYGMSSRTRITEFIINDSDTGHTEYPTFEVVKKGEDLLNEHN